MNDPRPDQNSPDAWRPSIDGSIVATFVSRGAENPRDGKGLPRPGVAMVGQAPGVREPAAQMELRWTAGRRLFKWLASIGYPEPQLRANRLYHRRHEMLSGKFQERLGDRKPAPGRWRNCAPYLEESSFFSVPRSSCHRRVGGGTPPR
jgi:uracil-DNA glycosylase